MISNFKLPFSFDPKSLQADLQEITPAVQDLDGVTSSLATPSDSGSPPRLS
ncbi:MAG: hypothetical protein ABI596_11815 [Pyrinomonadaceae bacterium]